MRSVLHYRTQRRMQALGLSIGLATTVLGAALVVISSDSLHKQQEQLLQVSSVAGSTQPSKTDSQLQLLPPWKRDLSKTDESYHFFFLTPRSALPTRTH